MILVSKEIGKVRGIATRLDCTGFSVDTVKKTVCVNFNVVPHDEEGKVINTLMVRGYSYHNTADANTIVDKATGAIIDNVYRLGQFIPQIKQDDGTIVNNPQWVKFDEDTMIDQFSWFIGLMSEVVPFSIISLLERFLEQCIQRYAWVGEASRDEEKANTVFAADITLLK